MDRGSASISQASRSTASWFTAFRLTASTSTTISSIAATSTASKYHSNHVLSLPPSLYPNRLNYGFQVHLSVHLKSAAKCISKLTQSRHSKCICDVPGSFGIPVHLLTPLITASINIIKERRRVYGYTGVTEVERVLGSVYSDDRRVRRDPVISILSYHRMKIRTLSFQTVSLARSIRDYLGSRNCVNPQPRVLSFLVVQLRAPSTPGSIICSHPIPTLRTPESLLVMQSDLTHTGCVLMRHRLCSSIICGLIDHM